MLWVDLDSELAQQVLSVPQPVDLKSESMRWQLWFSRSPQEDHDSGHGRQGMPTHLKLTPDCDVTMRDELE